MCVWCSSLMKQGRKTFAIFILGLLAFGYGQSPLNAQPKIPAAADQALFEILNLRTQTARNIIAQGRAAEPNNLYYDYLDNWMEVIELALYEQDERYGKYLQSFEERIKHVKATGNRNDPAYNILLGEMYVHAGMANILYNDYFDGFRKILTADDYVDENLEKHPGYWMNNKLSGTMNVGFDMMPSVLKWFANLFGLKGNANAGYRQLNQYLKSVNDQPGLKAEALLYYGFVLKLSKRDQEAANLLQMNTTLAQAPALNIFFLSTLQYISGNNEEAMKALSAFPKNKIELPFRHISYLEGREKINRLDPDAYIPFTQFLRSSNFKNNKRDVCLKLSYHYFMLNDKDRYHYYLQLINSYPKSKMDRDKEADVESARGYDPQPDILRSRFLVAGGYFSRAKIILQSIVFASLVNKAYQTEYCLLMAKVALAERRTEDAIAFCNKAIDLGRERKEHYAAEAALVAGLAAQQKNSSSQALQFWKMATQIDGQGDIYIENIHKIAKQKIAMVNSGSSH